MHQCEQWGIQVSPCYTDLLRATSRGKRYPILWEWVCTGQQLTPTEVQRIMKDYPVCEFQDDGDLAYRAMQRHKKMVQDSVQGYCLTAKVSGPQNAGPLDRRVRPEGQKGAPSLEDGRGPGKTAGPRKRRSAARRIAGGAYCTSAGGPKGR